MRNQKSLAGGKLKGSIQLCKRPLSLAPASSTLQRTDASANTLSHHLFTVHGLSLTGALDEPFGYRAKIDYYTDIETGFQLLTNRYYDPSSGRFLTRDPIGYAGGINLYSYVRNNPANYADPSGLIAGVLALPALPALPALGPALLPAGIAAAYAGILYGSWRFGEWLAERPWNPLTHPADPVFPPICPPIVSRSKEPWEPTYPIPPWYPPRIPPGPIPDRNPERRMNVLKNAHH